MNWYWRLLANFSVGLMFGRAELEVELLPVYLDWHLYIVGPIKAMTDRKMVMQCLSLEIFVAIVW